MHDASCRLLPPDSLILPEASLEREREGIEGLARSLRALGPLEPVLVCTAGTGEWRVIAGRRRVLAARRIGLRLMPVRVLIGTDPELIRAAENSTRRDLRPAAFVETVSELASSREPARVADALGTSVAHVENLVRLRHALDEEAWSAFQAEGDAGSLRTWLALGSLPKDEQRRALAARRRVGRPRATRLSEDRVRPARELEATLRRLPADDVRARTLRWVLDAGEFPEAAADAPTHASKGLPTHGPACEPSRRSPHPGPGRGDLTDEEWECLKRQLPPQRSGKAGRPPHDHRRLINGMLWIDRTGAPWRDLPARYGKWQTVSSRFYRWRRTGIWGRVLAALQRQPDATEPSSGAMYLTGDAAARLRAQALAANGSAWSSASG